MHDFEKGNPGHLRGRREQKRGSASVIAVVALVGFAAVACSSRDAQRSAGKDEETRSIAQSATLDTSPSGGGRSHVLSDSSDGAVGITVTLPGSGWSGEPGGSALETGPNGFDPPDGAGIIAFTVDNGFYVYGDPCEWQSTRPKKPATTVDDLAAALANQPSRNASAPEDITVDGYAGKRITLHVPDDAVFSDCDEGIFATFGVAGDDLALYVQGPGEIDEIWIVDVNGRLVVLDGGYYAGTPQNSVDELHAIVSSATFD
jgi:hypothetical protein